MADLPTIELGGTDPGDLRIAHEVGVDPLTGRASVIVPLDSSAGRGGFGPQLALRYDSAGTHSPYGAGWSLQGLLTITVSTRNGLPTYDARDAYTFGLSGELVPTLRKQGDSWVPRVEENQAWTVRWFRGRREAAQIRIEQWTEKASGQVHWRTRDAGNVLTIYGRTARIAGPGGQVYAWLPEAQFDPEGNAIVYEYAAENLDGVDQGVSYERSRAPALAQRYLKRIRYGNSRPMRPDVAEPADNRWHFELVFDYGDHAEAATPVPDRPWPSRPDPRSSYRAGFEVRTYRLCRRILQFHHFDQLGSSPVRVGEYVLEHDTSRLAATLRILRYTGFSGDGSSRDLPPLRFAYTAPAVDSGFLPAPVESTENAPAGLSGGYRWIDLYGDGLPGILSETGDAWYFKPNQGDGRFGPQQLVADRPAHRIGEVALADFDADGNPNLAVLHGRTGGYYAYDRDAGAWQGFRPFESLPHLEAAGAKAQWLDINGDGRSDLLVADAGRLTWYPSLGERGFGDPVEVAVPDPQRRSDGEALLLAEDKTLDYFFADMTGDGLADQVRIRNGRVEYWPQLGYGRFGAPILMEGAPEFAPDHEFDANRLFLVDLTGDGLADLLYVGGHEVHWWLNAGGNTLVPGGRLPLPTVDELATMQVLDFLGDGTPCLVWSSPLPGTMDAIRYLRLAGERPNLLLSVDNAMGAETRLTYSTSGVHYLRDRAAGRVWRTKLPVHHAVVDRYEVVDHVAGASSVTRFAYHDGRFDAAEQLALFCEVDQYDADVPQPGAPAEVAATTPACIRRWFHPGVDLRGPLAEAYAGDASAALLVPHVVEDQAGFAPGDYEQAVAALAGSLLREEVYTVGSDGRLAAHPITVTQHSYRVRALQPGRRGGNHAGQAAGADPSFLFFEAERLDAVYEQDGADPRVAHLATLEVDERGTVLASCALAYPRRAGMPGTSDAQLRLVVTGQRASYVHIDTADRYELGIPVDQQEFELAGLTPGPSGVLGWSQLRADVLPAMAAAVRFHEPLPAGPAARLIGHQRCTYWDDNRTAALPAGQVGQPTLAHHIEIACFTPELVTRLFGADVDATVLGDAGYVLADGHWWRIGETLHYHGADRFYLLDRAVRGDSATAGVAYDAADLHAVAAVDALGNTTRAALDYVHLEPYRVTDANGNVTEAHLDPLGVAVVTTTYGQVLGPAGQPVPYGQEPLSQYVPVASPTFAAVLADPAAYVQAASRYVFYELSWSAGNLPPRVLDLSCEDLAHDGTGAPPAPSRVEVQLAYLDGFARELQAKRLVEPGDAILRDGSGNLLLGPDGRPRLGPVPQRWQVSGHVVYNRKQEPVRHYEPFYSGTPDYEPDAAELGAFHATAYDAVGRPTRTDAPNGTLTRTAYGPWASTQLDANDTVLDSGYRLLREGLPPSDPERQAYEQATADAETPTIVHVDPAGRAVVRVETAASGPDLVTRTELDARGAEIRMTDPRGIVAFTLHRDMLQRVLRAESVDSGVVTMLPDAYDRAAHTWDSRRVHVRRSFDLLDRPTAVDVDGALGLDHRTEEFAYGESLADAALRNARGQLILHRDQAGTIEYALYSPAGEVLRSERRVRSGYEGEPDWAGPVALEPERYVSEHRYDAGGRLRRQLLPDGMDRRLEYLAGGGLARITVSSQDGQVSDLIVCDGMRYNARGERIGVVFGNGVEVTHEHDPETYLTSRITARRGGVALQDIAYTYDPVGNVTRKEDLVQRPGGPIITGVTVTAESTYTYDSFYQLRTATGRVHQGLLEHDYRPGVSDPDAMKGTRHLGFNNGAAVERYTRTYSYDLAGNLLQVRHVGASRTWVTDMWVSPTSNRSVPALDPAGNPVTDPEAAFDPVGNCRALAHLRAIDYSYRNAITRAVVIDRSGTGQPDDAEFYVYDGDGLRVRKVAQHLVAGQLEITEKLYLDGCEIKRIRVGANLALARTTSHLSDATTRVAQLHRWSVDTAGRETDDVTAVRVRYELSDHLGSAELALDGAGQVVAYEEYFPYGGTAFVAGDAVREVRLRDYRFCGKECDDATGLYQFGYRYYAPWIGRWMSPDPIGPEDDLNLYRYCLNNPIVHTDPMGLQTTGTQTQRRGRHIRYSTRQLPRALRGLRLTPEQTEQWNRGEIAIVRRVGSAAPVIMSRQEWDDLVRAEVAAGRTVTTAQVTGGPPRPKPAKPSEHLAAGLEDDPGGGGRGVTEQVGQGQQGAGPGTGEGTQPGGGEHGDDGTGGEQLGPDGNRTDSDGTSSSSNGGQTGSQTGTGSSKAGNSPTGAGAGENQGSGKGTGTGAGGEGKDGDGGGGKGKVSRRRAVGQGAGGQGPGGQGDGLGDAPDGAGGGVAGGQVGGVPGGMVGGELGGEIGGMIGGTVGGDPSGLVGGDVGGEGGARGAGPGSGTQPPPPGQTTNGDDPNGTGTSASGGIRSGAGTGGQGSGQRVPPGHPGGQGTGAGNGAGEHRGEHPNGTGGGQGDQGGQGTGTPTGWDRAVQIAGIAELEFGGDQGGESGGIPGGMGFLRGRGWQALYVGLVVVSLIGSLVKLAGKLTLKALSAGLRKAFGAVAALFTRKFWRAVGRRVGRYFTRQFWRRTWQRFLRTGLVRFVRDPRKWKTVSRWRRAGRGWATSWELHHWVFPQRWTFIPQWARNAGFNLVLVPRWLNNYMGRSFAVGSARWFLSRGMEWFVRIAIPASLAGGGYGGYRVGTWVEQRDQGPSPNPRTPQQRPPQTVPTP
jgi:RHS repeat-associated protein